MFDMKIYFRLVFQSLIEYLSINRSNLCVLEMKRNDEKAFVKQ